MTDEVRPVRVEDILLARDRRAARQQEWLDKYHLPLISFTMNIAGEIKSDALIRRAFLTGVERIERLLARKGFAVKERMQLFAFTGCEALWAVAADAQEIKAQMLLLEEEDALGRLFDMDVIDAQGAHLSRGTERTCLICGGPVRACARVRMHSAQQLYQRAREIIRAHYDAEYLLQVGEAAQRALMYEALTTPKPGLVDMENSGAHRDMDIFSFADAICALRRYFEDCARMGLEGASVERLQHAGRLAEEKMLSAAHANTHKGAVFSLGILCYAAGCCGEGAEIADILQKAAEIGAYFLTEMQSHCRGVTGGEKQYAAYGLTGARGEAASGFETVTRIALPALEAALRQHKSLPQAGLEALMYLIMQVKDSNIIRRAGLAGQEFAAAQAEKVLQNGCMADDLRALNDLFVEKNISPGGSADLLAVTYFLHFLVEGGAS